MHSQGYISKQDIANLDQKFDSNVAGLNKMLDRVLDKSVALQTFQPPIQQIQTPLVTQGGTQNLQQGGYQNPYLAGASQQYYPQVGQAYQSTPSYGYSAGDSGLVSTQPNYGNTPPYQSYQYDPSKQSMQTGSVYSSYEGNPLTQSYPNIQFSPGQYQSITTESGTKLRIKEPEESSAQIDKKTLQRLVYDTSAPAYIGGQTGLNQPGLSQNPSGFSTTQTRPEHSAEKENVQPNTQGQNQASEKPKVMKRRRRKSTTPIVEQTIEQVEKDMAYMNKFTTEEILKTLEQTEEGQLYIIDSIRRSHKPTRISRHHKPTSETKKEDPIDQIVVSETPIQEEAKQEGLISIYQQVSEVYEDGTKYEGEKFLGKRHGKGTYYYQEGYKYEGNWEEDQMSGFGILWINDDVKWYEGEWYDNVFHGRGILYNLNTEDLKTDQFYGENFSTIGNGWLRYEGQFYKGAKHGFGILFLTNGDQFVGNFNSDNIHGRGSYTKPGQYVIAGMWENNVLTNTF